MARAPFQVLVYPYRQSKNGQIEYALLRRSDQGFWQGIAGGGEDDETPLDAAMRETYEETGIPPTAEFLRLDTVEPIPVYHFSTSHIWGDHIYVIPQYTFGVATPNLQIVLSHEHTAYRWLFYEEAYELLRYDGNKTALWELDKRLKGKGPRG